MTQSDLGKFTEEMRQSTEQSSNTNNEWKLEKIEDVCVLNPGSINDDSFDYDTMQYLEISNSGDGYIKELEEYQIEDAPSRAKRTVSKGHSVISTVRPNREHYVFIEEPPENLVVSTGFAVLYPKNPDRIMPEYLYYVVTHPVFIDYLDANATGSAYPAVNLDIIKKGVIPTPDSVNQERIVNILGVFDSKIKQNMKEIKKLRELRDILIPEFLPPEKME
jgi:type I restriction enzyme S subunit